MATLPQIKLEGGANVKLEDAHSPASLASDQFMDDVEDDPELSTNEAQKALWMARFPPWLWAALEHANDDEEIDLGTIRIEGSFDNPDRVSLLLNDAPFSKEVEKEYVLKKPTVAADLRRIKRPGGSLMFSEKNRPGYKQKEMYWEEEGPGRSQLYDQLMRAQKKKQRKEEPEEDYKEYVRKPIPKITALAGTFLQEFDCVPVNTEEHRRLAAAREEALQEKKPEASMIVDHNHFQTQYGSNISAAQRQNIQRVSFLGLVKMKGQLLTVTRTRKRNVLLPKRIVLHDQIQLNYAQTYSTHSANTSIGVFATYVCICMNLNQLSRKFYKRSPICIVLVISMESGS